MIKKSLAILTLLAITIAITGCNEAETQAQKYIAKGRYYTDGLVVTSDGNEWAYNTDTISDKPSYNSEPVYVAFNDAGTPNNIYDDIILGLVFDRETAIYDSLEMELSKEFTIERSGNTIKIE